MGQPKVDVGGGYYNTKAQVRELTAVLDKLPRPDAMPTAATNRSRIRRARQLNDDAVRRLITAYQAGATAAELGTQFGINRQTVGKILKRHGIRMKGQGLTAQEIDLAARLYEAGRPIPRSHRTELRHHRPHHPAPLTGTRRHHARHPRTIRVMPADSN